MTRGTRDRTQDDAIGDIAPGTRLIIVRHGEAVCNVNSFIGGHRGCSGLTDRGRRQAELLSSRLLRTEELTGASALWTSILPRAIETAQILSKALNLDDFKQTCDLCERHPGEADGLTWEEFERRYRRMSLPGDNPEVPLSPGGESWISFLDRSSLALARLAADNPEGLVVVVAHGGIIDSSIIRFLQIADHGTGIRLHPDHTSLTEWAHTGTRWRLVRYNDAAHLAEPNQDELRTPVPTWVRADPALAIIDPDETQQV